MFYSLTAGVEIYSLKTVVWALCAGAALSAFVMLYYKVFLGEFVRRLIKSGADSPENAVDYLTLFPKKGKFLAFVINTSSNAVWRSVSVCGMENLSKSVKAVRVDVYKSKFYITPEAADTAGDKYNKRGTGIFTALLACAVLAAIALLLLKFVPSITGMIDKIFGE